MKPTQEHAQEILDLISPIIKTKYVGLRVHEGRFSAGSILPNSCNQYQDVEMWRDEARRENELEWEHRRQSMRDAGIPFDEDATFEDEDDTDYEDIGGHGEELGGTCTIGIDHATIEDVLDALETVSNYGGDEMVLVAGDSHCVARLSSSGMCRRLNCGWNRAEPDTNVQNTPGAAPGVQRRRHP
jgi:hypothetical protein